MNAPAAANPVLEDARLLPPEQVAPQIQTSALKLLAWAHRRGLLTADAYHPGDAYEDPQLEGATAAGIAILRQKWIRAVGTNAPAGEIVVFLARAVPGVRQVLTLPSHCDGFTLRYHQGNPEAVTPAAVAQAATPCAVVNINGRPVYTCGSSVSVGNARSAGTLGCLVRDAGGTLFGLSNNHVVGGCNYAPGGLPILAPGVLDVGPAMPHPFTLGVHERQLPMLMGDPTTVDTIQNQDVAIFRLTCPDRVSSQQQTFYDTPGVSMPLVPGLRVRKVGRSSGYTEGTVIGALVGPQPVNYSAPEHSFNGPVYFDGLHAVVGSGDRFSEPGDSGSLVVHEALDGNLYAVGLVVAGQVSNQAPGNLLSLILPIQPILGALNVSLVAGHNT